MKAGNQWGTFRAGPEFAARRLRKLIPEGTRLGLVLGSGFGGVVSALRRAQSVAYGELPGLPPVGVTGHAGEVVFGKLSGTPVIALSGRVHFYEGHSMDAVTFAVRMLAALDITDLLLTNAAGGINPRFRPGDFMVLTDHLNFMGANPLRGPEISGRPRFVDLTKTYDRGLNALLRRAAKSVRMPLRAGVYMAVSGPSYETPAEVRAYAGLGADAVGMSTVPEAIVARQCGLRVAAVSCITNLAAGRSAEPLSHSEVLDVAKRVGQKATALMERFVKLYGDRY